MCKSESFSVALRVRHGEIACLVLVEIPALYLCDNCDRSAVQTCDSAVDRLVIAIEAVAVKFIIIREDQRHIVLYSRSAFCVDEL